MVSRGAFARRPSSDPLRSAGADGSGSARAGWGGAPRSSYVAGTPTPGKMSLFIGSYCFHSCPAQDVLVDAQASLSERGRGSAWVGRGEDVEGT